jgi:tRNA(adenine34) deaminase
MDPRQTPEARFMRQALRLAAKAAAAGEVPVGALLVQGPLDAAKPLVLARAHNVTETRHDPVGHAEIQVIRRAAKKLGRWRLNDCTLVVTLEPCAMCAGAAVWARMGRIVYGARDPKAGACGSVLTVIPNPALNHRPLVTEGVLEDECAAVLRAFFRERRRK